MPSCSGKARIWSALYLKVLPWLSDVWTAGRLDVLGHYARHSTLMHCGALPTRLSHCSHRGNISVVGLHSGRPELGRECDGFAVVAADRHRFIQIR